MFTDLEGFTKMSESLAPAEVSRILTSYFSQTTRAILEQDGTITKYIGDAVMAVWGVPLPEVRHAERAVLAAWGMHKAGQQEIAGRKLRTRIGINTGRMLAGNLGSEFRFDYTVIGDATNFASRLEGLNKYLGTDILISETTRAGLSAGIKLRPLGRFLVSGKTTPVAIYEVLGPTAEFSEPAGWLDTFAAGLKHFESGDLAAAESAMRETLRLREERDGPARFYLQQIEKARAAAKENQPWTGVVVLESK
jgi:adenylate cyclase